MEASFFDKDLKAMEKSMDLIRHWNAERLVDKVVKLNRPQVWKFEADARVGWAGRKALVEPFVHNYQKFNSNSGWADDRTPWPRVMQALSHYSYHKSGGQFILCDLQGGVYRDGVVLTDPVILSRTRQYGVTDLGAEGMSTFFSRHECNEFCRSHWQKPRDMNAYFAERQGTSMAALDVVPTRHSRQPMSGFAAVSEESESDDY